MECLIYAHENGCEWDDWICTSAAENGRLECLKYAHENGCPWDKDACKAAVASGHLDCLIYLHEEGCPWDLIECITYAYRNQSYSMVDLCKRDKPIDFRKAPKFIDCIEYLYNIHR